MKFEQRLKILRNDRKMTQSELGKILGYGYTAISNYENGRCEPSIENLVKLADFFDIPLDFLLCRTNGNNKETYVKEELKVFKRDIFFALNEIGFFNDINV